jgi:hypothetical protein
MNFILTINCDNDAFLPIIGDELARILREVAARVEGCESPHLEGNCRDYNGNKVGSYKVEGD